jgi:hypothetical protein
MCQNETRQPIIDREPRRRDAVPSAARNQKFDVIIATGSGTLSLTASLCPDRDVVSQEYACGEAFNRSIAIP